jgi:hypothetical protein
LLVALDKFELFPQGDGQELEANEEVVLGGVDADDDVE